MKNSNKDFKKQDKTFNDKGGVSDKLVKLKNDRLQANKDKEEIKNSNSATIQGSSGNYLVLSSSGASLGRSKTNLKVSRFRNRGTTEKGL